MIEKVVGDVIGELERLHPDNDEMQKEINVAIFHLNRVRVAAQQSVQSDGCPSSSNGKHKWEKALQSYEICYWCGTRR